MAIGFVSLTTYSTTTPTLPPHQKGDVLLMSSVGAALPAPTTGWIKLGSVFSTTRNGLWYKIATGTDSESGGTWTGASLLCLTIHRDDTNWLSIGQSTAFSGFSFSVFLNLGSVPRVADPYAGIYSVNHWSYNKDDVDVAGNVGAFTDRGGLQAGGYTIAGFDTNGLLEASTAIQSRVFTVGTSGFYSSYSAQLMDTGVPLVGSSARINPFKQQVIG